MEAFDPSPRASKKRKTAIDEPTFPVYSRVLRTVKQVVYGKAASPKINSEVFDETVKTPVKIVEESPLGRRSGRPHEDAKTPTDPALHERSKGYALDKGDPAVRSVPRDLTTGTQPSKTKSTNHEDLVIADPPQTSTRKRRLKHKGWIYIEDKDELAQEDASGRSEGLDDEVGRLKRGREDLTIDMNPEQLKPRKSHHIAKDVRIDGNNSITPTTGKAFRISKRTETKAEEASSVKVDTGSVSHQKEGRQRKRVANARKPLVGKGEQSRSAINGNIKDASPDELAYVSQAEDPEQESATQTPTRRSKETRDTRRSRTAEESPHVAETFARSIQEEGILESEPPIDDRIKALQATVKIYPEGVKMLKTHLVSGLTGKRRVPLVGLEDENQNVKQIVEQTILAGEGNSMLIVGSRGSGKTLLVETVITELSSNHGEDFHVVRLNGFIHTDDKLALREIWRQLGREMEVENDDLTGRSNYADTLTSLLALLAHPAAGEAEEDQAATARSVIFVLDEFDLFASHPRQTLLYNLFDVAQSRNAPIVVLGLTTKVNVVDTLEKRVKSRFGQRYVHVSMPKTFSAFQKICLSALKCRPSTQELLQDKANAFQQLSTVWNDYVELLFETPTFLKFLQTLYTSTKAVPAFVNASLLQISILSPTNLPSLSSFSSSTLRPPDSKLHLIPSLSALSLSLLVAAARLDIILDTNICTFGMAYEEYVNLAGKSKLQSSAAGQVAVGGGGARVWSKELARGAWEQLGKLEFVLPASGGTRAAAKGEMWRVDVGLEEIGGLLESEGSKGSALSKWCREI